MAPEAAPVDDTGAVAFSAPASAARRWLEAEAGLFEGARGADRDAVSVGGPGDLDPVAQIDIATMSIAPKEVRQAQRSPSRASWKRTQSRWESVCARSMSAASLVSAGSSAAACFFRPS